MNCKNANPEERTASGWESVARDALARDLEADAQSVMRELSRLSNRVEDGDELTRADVDLLASELDRVEGDLDALREVATAE